MKHFTNVHTPDFASQLQQNENPKEVAKSLNYSNQGTFVSRTSAPASLFNSPDTVRSPLNTSPGECEQQKPYTQHLEETIIDKYSAVKEVFNNLSGEETESIESEPASPLSPALIPALSARTARSRPIVPPIMADTLLDESGPNYESEFPGHTNKFPPQYTQCVYLLFKLHCPCYGYRWAKRFA